MTHGILVLEGPDASGKSTLAERFRLEHNAVVIHATNRWPKNMWNYHDAILRRAVKLAFGPAQRLVVLDRHWPSELVYGPIFRPQIYNRWIGRMFDRVLRRFNCQYIWCMPTEANIPAYLERYQQNVDPGHPYDELKIRDILSTYQLLFYGLDGCSRDDLGVGCGYADSLMVTGGLKNRGDVCHYDLDGDSPQGVIGVVLERLKRPLPGYQDNSSYFNLGGDPTTAKVVLVGDRTNPNKVRPDHRHTPWPFHDYRDSSLFLAQQLDLAGVREEDICVINGASDYDLTCELEMLRKIKRKRAVFLGGLAKLHTLGPGGFSAGIKVPHPSYAKRFKVKDYHLLLKEAVYG